ncbi:hypothetical protein CK203_036776 [Vitis vinifera]|uniref:Retrotransposon gag domain-containing protein n=1 Tax=Vitis vinifera TaxID=29760 RepID=A0A438I0U2_VITVI|nr:hypothetical protein CK203_036776 [Vitis vinifera]
MAQKMNEGRVDCLEKEVGEIRKEMQRLLGMEKTVMDLAQNVMRVLQLLEKTQKVVAALSLGRNTTTAAQREDRAGWIPGVGEPKPKRLDLSGQSILCDVRTHGRREISSHRNEFRWGHTLLYQWTNSREVFGSWENLKRRLLLRFRPTQERSLCEQFLAVRQQGTVAAYQWEFEIMATPLKGISDKVMESTFMNGLFLRSRNALVGDLRRREGKLEMLTMKIKMGKVVIVLKGDPTLSRTKVSLEAIARALQHHSQGCVVHSGEPPTTRQWKEMSLAKPQLEYLGHLVSAKGVVADPNKISAMVE